MHKADEPDRYAGGYFNEWPTWVMLAICHAAWAVSLVFWDTLWPLIAVPAALSVALHSSLQHEILHGHPTRSGLINEILVSLPVGLAIPYRRFRDLHLKHHNDDRLTDPYDDPESFYLPPERWGRASPVIRAVFRINGTFAGRLVIGPALAMVGFWRTEIRLMLAGDHRVIGAWLRHGVGVAVVLAILDRAGVPVWQYVLGAAYPGMSLIMVRSFIEHRAAPTTAHRTAIVEAGPFWRLLFLNNNLHSVHHEHPTIAWFRLGAIWQRERDRVLERNGGYYLKGYGEVLRRWGIRRREPLVHPFRGWDNPTDPT